MTGVRWKRSQLLIFPGAISLHQRRGDPWCLRMKLLGGALATSIKCYFTALPDKNAFLFGLSSEGGGLFVMRLRSMHINSVGRSSPRCREDRFRVYSLIFNPSIFPLI